ncbi:MAG: DUF4349 domain-containing protein [Chloroflexi bacterium]|nr:DUF4349 domain-containing protein [Chloroflexota bacterium]
MSAPEFRGEAFGMDSVASNQPPSPTLGKASGGAIAPGGQAPSADGSPVDQTASRLIVRTADLTIEVADVPESMDAIAALAGELDGWVLTSQRSALHQGFISIRVPSTQLDEAIQRLRGMAVEVKAENSSARDVTEEFIDIQARVRNLEATEAKLLTLLERPGEIKDVLEVQREITRVREEIERLVARSNYLQQTAAFSLISVNLQATPGEIGIDAGIDRILVEGESVRFRATFTPPEGMEDFTYEWDFGDGSPITYGNRTAPTADEGTLTTVTVTHTYRDDEDSPFFVSVKITGTGEGGIAEGEDSVVVAVTAVPNIQVSAGNNKTVKADERLALAGTFTRPEGVINLTYRWDFGDGLSPIEATVDDNASTVTAEHIYSIDRTNPYTVTLTITGETENGASVKASDSLLVQVVPASRWFVAILDLDETARAAVRTLSGAAQAVVGFGIWAVVFSPLWIGLLVLLRFAGRRWRWNPRRRPSPTQPPAPTDGSGTR